MELSIGTICEVPVGSTFSCPRCWQLSRMSGVVIEHEVSCVVCNACGVRIPAGAAVLGAGRRAAMPDSGAVPSLRPKNFLTAPKDNCPRCIAPRTERNLDCVRCGLVFKDFKEATVAPSKQLAKAFVDVVLRWSDATQHDHFQRLAIELNELVAAERLYAIWLTHLPKDPWGLKGKLELTVLCGFAAAAEKNKNAPLLSPRMRLVALGSLALISCTIAVGFGLA